MPESPPPRPTVLRPRRVARYALLLLVPAAIAIKLWLDRPVTPQDVTGFGFARPAGWTYLTETAVEPDGRRIHFGAEALAEAITQGQAAPLFAVAKYDRPRGGLNPVIGVNVAYQSAGEVPSADALLRRGVEAVRERTDGGLEALEAISTTTVHGLPAARVVLGRQAPAQRLMVTSIVVGRTSLLIAAVGRAEGEDAIDDELARFVDSLTFDPH